MANNPITRFIRIVFDKQSAKQTEADAKKSLGVIGTGINRLKQSVKEFGVTLAAAFSARAIGRFFSSSIKEFSDFDAAMTRSTAIMGDLDDAMRKDMVTAAKTLSEELNLSATDVAESFYFLASAGLDAKQSIAALPIVAKFAKAGAFDLATATDLLTDAQSALGLSMKDDVIANMREMTRVSDVLAAANKVANASMQQFSEALTNKAGAALRSFGKDVEEGVAVLAVYADQGLKGAAAGEALSIVLRELQRATRENKDEFAKFGISVFGADGSVRNMADIISELERALKPLSVELQGAALAQLGFTERSISNLRALLGTSDALRNYEATLRSAAGTTQEIADRQMQAFAEQWGKVTQQLRNAKAALGEAILEALNLEENLPRISAAIKAFADNVERVVSIIGSAIKASLITGFVRGLLALRTAAIAAGGGVAAFAASIRGLWAAIGPAGWAILGLTVLIELFRDTGEEAERAARKSAEAIAGLKSHLATLSKETLDTSLETVRKERAEVLAEIERLRNLPIPKGDFRGSGPLVANRRASQIRALEQRATELQDQENLLARERNRRVIEARTPTTTGTGTGTGAPDLPPVAVPGSEDGEKDPIKEALDRYAQQMQSIKTLSALLGTEFDATAAKTNALTQVITALALEGVGPTDERMLGFRDDLAALRVEEDKVGDALKEHDDRMRQTQQAAALLGESYNALDAEARTLNDTINTLLDLGLDAGDPRLQAFAARLLEVRDAIKETGDAMADAEAVGQEFAGILGAALGAGIGPYAKQKAKQNLLEAAELAAQALVASFNPLAVGKAPALLAAAAKHTAIAASWTALAGSAGGAPGGLGGGGGAAGLASAQGASGDFSRRADRDRQDVTIVLSGTGWSALNPEVQSVVFGAQQKARERYGNNTQVRILQGG